ncbi:MAG: hypothetical protein LBB89_03505 [Treponema sp.]|jgi:hypothetical protein|nr:hypothetical protein [Treponema sp.]
MYSDIVIFKENKPRRLGYKFLVSSGFQVYETEIKSKLLRFFFKVCRKLRIYHPFLSKIFWNIDISNLSKAAYIIVFNGSVEYYFCSFLQRYLKNSKLMFYYWDLIDNEKEKIINYFRPLWNTFSFDENDCHKYKLKYSKMFVNIANNYCLLNIQEIQQDIIFIGNNKGRIKRLMEIKQEFDKLGIRYKFICTGAEEFSNQGIYTEGIPYEEVLVEYMKSRAILDINYNDVYGQTIREIDTFFLKKKLITDNSFVKERDYYHPDNVYIIDYSRPDFLDGIKDFLEKPFVPIDEEILKSYSVEAWIQRFMEQ